MSDTDRQIQPEPGWLARVRCARDLFPWLALGDALGPATSVVALLLSLIAIALTIAGDMGIGWCCGVTRSADVPSLALRWNLFPAGDLLSVVEFFSNPSRDAFRFGRDPDAHFGANLHGLLRQLWLWLVWCVPAGYVMRRTVLTAAGRVQGSSRETLRLVVRRSGAMIGGPLLLFIGVVIVAALYGLVGWLCRVPTLGTLASWFLFPVAIGGGLLLAGLLAGLFLMWSAAVTEEFADAFDLASRGFEYLLQRPLRALLYTGMAVVVSGVMIFLVQQVLRLAIYLSVRPIEAVTDLTDPTGLGAFASLLLLAYGINLSFALSSIVYLLLRRDANHQEIEDIWEPPTHRRQLPELRLDENGVPIPPDKTN